MGFWAITALFYLTMMSAGITFALILMELFQNV